MKTKQILILSAFLLIPTVGVGADHDNLEEHFPTEVEDAYPIPFGGVEFQGAIRYQERDKRGRDLNELYLFPQIEWGMFPNFQFGVSVPFRLEDADPYGSGDTRIKGLYNFNTEGKWLPAFAIAGEADAPTGEENTGVDTGAKLIMTKTITKAGTDRIHLNAAIKHDDDAYPDFRDNRFVGVAGYSRRLDADTILVTDYVYEQEHEEGEESHIAEVGLRRQLTPQWVVSAGVGAGLTEDSPDWRATIGVQYSIGRPARKPTGRKITTILSESKPSRYP